MPESYRVIILPRASADLQAIFAHIEQQSPQNAAGVARRVIDALEQLPHRHKVHTTNRQPALIVRSMPVPPYIVYYRTDDRRRAVRVLAIRHGARRQPRRFYE